MNPSQHPSQHPSLHPSLHPKSLTPSASGSSLASGAADHTKLISWVRNFNFRNLGNCILPLQVASEKVTPFSPLLMERMARVKTIYNQWGTLIEKIRNSAQTNPAFRGERLVPSGVNMVSDRQHFSAALRDAGAACFDNLPPCAAYMTEMANAQQTITGYHDVMLRQTMVFAVKPLKEYQTIHYPKIKAAYAELEKRRDKYDSARLKKSPTMHTLQQHLCDQAGILDGLLNLVPEHQINGAKAIDFYIRAECQFMREISTVFQAIKRPDHKSRWVAS